LIITFGFKNEDIDYWQDKNNEGSDFCIDAKKIYERLTQVIRISKSGDTLIFYISGHGYYQEGKSYLVAASGTSLHGNFYNTSHVYINFIYFQLSMHILFLLICHMT
jgi:hypothetical protein